MKKCGRCRQVRYCSQECLDGDRKVHKKVCKKIGEEKDDDEEEETEKEEKEEEEVEKEGGGKGVVGGGDEEKEEAVRVCEKCGKEAMKMNKCSACRLVWYCSRECQLGDWKAHKKACKKVKQELTRGAN